VKSAGSAVARVREVASEELVERLLHLDGTRLRSASAPEAPRAPDRDTAVDFDVVLAGGGLWLVIAPLLASRGLKVAVLDRARAGSAHREWNASGPELETLVRSGLFRRDELNELIVARYDRGFCRFHNGGTYDVPNVLDHAVDAGPLLSKVRSIAEARGVTFFDHHEIVSEAAGRTAIAIRAKNGTDRVELVARWMVDARGAASPYASADLVCPTVGGVISGLDEGDGPLEVDPRAGEILVTVDPIDPATRRQHVWEGFPGRHGELTTYVFYYARAEERVSLVELYGRFFDTLSTYKRGDAKLVRPTFGFIPGWSRLSAMPAAPPRIVLVGDAAARHSPLTYCGFGATLRSFEGTARAIANAVERGHSRVDLADHEAIHSLTGALAHMMSARGFSGDELNDLLDAAFATLHRMGPDAYASLLRDEMRPARFVEFLRKTAALHPRVWGKVARGLGVRAAGKWSLGVARSMFS